MPEPLPEPDHADITTLRKLLVDRETTYRDATFLRFEDRAYTYAELASTSNRIANALLERGLRPGDRLAIWMRNRPEYLACLFAAAKAGLVAVTLNPAARAVDGRYLLEDSQAKAIVLGPEVADAFATIRAQLSDPPPEFVTGARGDTTAHELAAANGLRPYDELLSGSAQLPPDPGIGPGTPASIIYTSGTTGPPKGVVLPHGAYPNTARWYGQHVLGAGPDDVFFTCLPLHHCNAQIFTTATALMHGASVAMVENFSASRFLDQLRHYGATVFNFIGMMLVALYKQPVRADDADNPATRAFGIPVPPDLGREFEQRFGVTLLEGYGATETGCGFVFSTPSERRWGYAGRALPYAEVRVVDEEDNDVPTGEVGRIIMRPKRDHIWMLEYHGKPEATAKATRDGWLRLDDFGVFDEGGWLAFRGRGLDWVRRRGENISAIEIEDTCDRHPSVAKSAVVAVPSPLTEEEVKLYVEWKPDAEPDVEGLIAWLRERLAEYKLPRFVDSIPEIPRTATGKIAKYRLDRSPNGQWDAETARTR